tara:strand:- start:11442 stop:12374 length:933 start_codon:yes stop_codon:yes gene_type:complete
MLPSNLAFVFPGQGSQSEGMLSEYLIKEKNFNLLLNEAKDILNIDFFYLLKEANKEEISLTEITQPLVFVTNLAIWKCLNPDLISIKAMAGHSLGEYAALVAAESINFEDALILVSSRAKLMQEAVPEGRGGIAAILGLKEDEVNTICKSVTQEGDVVEIANLNSPQQIVISGSSTAVQGVISKSKEAGAKRAIPLSMSIPSHCSLMKPAANKFKLLLENLEIRKPKTIVFQNVTAKAPSSEEEIRDNLVTQLYSPVKWTQTIQNINSLGISNFIECGPGKVLSGLIKRISKDSTVLTLDNYSSFQGFNK